VKRRFLYALLGLAVLACGLYAFVFLQVRAFERSQRICRDVFVADVRLGGLSTENAKAVLKHWAKQQLARRITITALDARWSGSLYELGFRVPIESAINKAYQVGRSGSIVQRAICVLTPWGVGKQLPIALELDEGELRAKVEALARRVDRPHKDARLKIVDNRLEVVPDACGIRVNLERSIDLIKRSVRLGSDLISLPVEVDQPDVTATDAAKITVPLSSFTTWFNPAKVERTHNLRLAANAINGIILKPGMKFSANEIIGPRLASRGFRPAQIFVRGKLEEGIGGGVCQVSSTLYNAVLLAGLKVVERSHHSRLVPYVGPGRDATVVYGLRDFKFVNTNSSPIAIISQIKGSRLTIAIYGSPSDKKIVKIYTSQSKVIPPGVQALEDPSLPAGVRKVVEKGSNGVSVTVYRTITFPNGKTVTEVVSRDRYLPQDMVVAVGVSRRGVGQDKEGSVVVRPADASSQLGSE
jgi:vancomycin resistance protein VanW